MELNFNWSHTRAQKHAWCSERFPLDPGTKCVRIKKKYELRVYSKEHVYFGQRYARNLMGRNSDTISQVLNTDERK